MLELRCASPQLKHPQADPEQRQGFSISTNAGNYTAHRINSPQISSDKRSKVKNGHGERFTPCKRVKKWSAKRNHKQTSGAAIHSDWRLDKPSSKGFGLVDWRAKRSAGESDLEALVAYKPVPWVNPRSNDRGLCVERQSGAASPSGSDANEFKLTMPKSF